LGFESHFFYGEPLDEFHDAECAFRKRVTTQLSVRNRALACGTLFGQLVVELKRKVRLPLDRLIDIDCRDDNDIERAADRCRIEWEIALDLPIDNVVRLAEGVGVPIAQFREIGEKVDSFSRVGSPSVIVLTDKPASRCRYDVAHELGHLVLHRGKPTGSKETEAQANKFAAALLMPARRFLREFPRQLAEVWERLFKLKQRWRVSIAAMIRRAYECGAISSTEYTRLYKELSARGWLRKEPYEFEPEQPETISLALQTIGDHLKLAPQATPKALGWKAATFERVTGIAIAEDAQSRVKSAKILAFPHINR
jgi:Zn-dependent peptidase ImmA (M78 family)